MKEERKSSLRATGAQDVVALVNDLLFKAVRGQASDIHFEPTEHELLVKYRLDGQLQIVERLPKSLADNIVARLKVLAGLLTYRNDIPQEGRIISKDTRPGRIMDKRLAVFPTINGQRAVVRLFYQNEQLKELSQLGLPESIYQCLEDFISENQGVLLVTGPAGSGKSTTLAALMNTVLKRYPGRSVVTVEDPVEIRINGATQVQIPAHGEMTFPVALRSLLRQDPEVLMLGEIRDAETARIAIEAGLTGHLLASTMHSGSPAGALLRLLEMGIEPYQVTSSVTAVINQRLVRHACDQCQTKGCKRCLGTGFRGRVLLAEALPLTSEVRRSLIAKADIRVLQQLQRDTMWQSAQKLVSSGITTQAEIDRICTRTKGN